MVCPSSFYKLLDVLTLRRLRHGVLRFVIESGQRGEVSVSPMGLARAPFCASRGFFPDPSPVQWGAYLEPPCSHHLPLAMESAATCKLTMLVMGPYSFDYVTTSSLPQIDRIGFFPSFCGLSVAAIFFVIGGCMIWGRLLVTSGLASSIVVGGPLVCVYVSPQLPLMEGFMASDRLWFLYPKTHWW